MASLLGRVLAYVNKGNIAGIRRIAKELPQAELSGSGDAPCYVVTISGNRIAYHFCSYAELERRRKRLHDSGEPYAFGYTECPEYFETIESLITDHKKAAP